MNDFPARIRALGLSKTEFPKLTALAGFVEQGLPLLDLLHGMRLGAGDLEEGLATEWRRLTDGIDRQLSVDLAAFALPQADGVADVCFLHCQWGVALGGMGENAASVDLYRQLLTHLADESGAYVEGWRAWAYNGIAFRSYLIGRNHDAIEAAREAVRLDGSQQGWRNILAMALYAVGEREEALEQMEAVFAIAKRAPTASPQMASDPDFAALFTKHGMQPSILEVK